MTDLVDPIDQGGIIGQMTVDIVDQKQLAGQLLEQAKEQNIELVGPGGLLNQLTKNVPAAALDAEMIEQGKQRRLPQRDARQDGADGDRPGGDRGCA